MVFSLLTFIAELKPNVIFAMEEPEIRDSSAHSTPHRAVPANENGPVDPDDAFSFRSRAIRPRGRGPARTWKRRGRCRAPHRGRRHQGEDLQGQLRRVLADAMLGNGVLCVEGISDGEAIYTASAVLEEGSPEEPTRRSTCPALRSCSAKATAGCCATASSSRRSGLRTYAFYDRQKNDAISNEIDDVFDATWELEQTGIEYLLADETTIDVIHRFLSGASEWDDYPDNPMRPEQFAYDPVGDDDDVRRLCRRILKSRKGSGLCPASRRALFGVGLAECHHQGAGTHQRGIAERTLER